MVDVLSTQKLRALLNDRPVETLTFEVSKEAAQHAHTSLPGQYRLMRSEEVARLADYLGVAPDELQGPFRVSRDLVCSGCGRELDFLDVATTAVESNVHGRHELAAVLTGEAGYWVTVMGRDGGRTVKCTRCGMVVPGGCYGSENYDYA